MSTSAERKPAGQTVRSVSAQHRLKLDRDVVQLVAAYVSEQRIAPTAVIFTAELVAPPRRTKAALTQDEIKALGNREPVRASVRPRHNGRLRAG
jgi:hypothetical protein